MIYKTNYGYKVSIEIYVKDGSKHVRIHAPLYKNKIVDVGFCFSTQFSDHEIMQDRSLVTKLINMYG